MVLSSIQMPVAEILSLNICGLISQMLKVILFFSSSLLCDIIYSLVFSVDKEINLVLPFFLCQLILPFMTVFLFYLPKEESRQMLFLKYKTDL